jgi:hypothetical protein
MMLLTYITGLFNAIVLSFALHPIHVTVTEIEFDREDKMLKIMMRVFIDDFELALREHANQPALDVLDEKNGMTKQMVSGYLEQHFRITLDNKAQKINYLGHEKESDAFIFYIEVVNVKKWKTIGIFNDILTGLHDDQSNLVHVTANGGVKSLRLTRNTSSDKLSFDNK